MHLVVQLECKPRSYNWSGLFNSFHREHDLLSVELGIGRSVRPTGAYGLSYSQLVVT